MWGFPWGEFPVFSPIAAFSQGGKPAGRVEVLSIAQSFHGSGSCLSDRSQKCHKTKLIRSLYILKIHKNAMCLFCVLGKCRYTKVGPYNSLFHLMSFVSSTYCPKSPDSLHHVFMFLMGQEPSNWADIKFWKKTGDANQAESSRILKDQWAGRWQDSLLPQRKIRHTKPSLCLDESTE